MGRTIKPDILERIRPLVLEQELRGKALEQASGLNERDARWYAQQVRAETPAPNGQGEASHPPAAEVKDVFLNHIRLDGDTQARVWLNHEVLAEYAEAMTEGAIFPAVTLFYDGEQYWIGDGFHRIHAADSLGFNSIRAEVRQGDRRDARLYACAANAAHGLRRTNADKRKAVRLLLADEQGRTWSDGRIARHCRVTQPFVSKVRAELSHNGYEMPATRTVKRGEQAYALDTSRIGQHADGPVEDLRDAEPPTPPHGASADDDLAGDPTLDMSGGPWNDTLEDVLDDLLKVLDGIDEHGGIAAVTRTWTPAHLQHFCQRLEEFEAQWQRLLREFRAVSRTITLDPAEAAHA